jgi:hypothetical protein
MGSRVQKYIHPALNSAGFWPGEPQRLGMLLRKHAAPKIRKLILEIYKKNPAIFKEEHFIHSGSTVHHNITSKAGVD